MYTESYKIMKSADIDWLENQYKESLTTQDITTPESSPGFRYGELYPLISGIIVWTCLIALFVGLRHLCYKGVKKCRNWGRRLSMCLSTTRPFSYCWTYSEDDDESVASTTQSRSPYSRNSSYIEYTEPPEYSVALDMPKPHHEEQEMAEISRHCFDNHVYDNNEELDSVTVIGNDEDQNPPPLHRPETDPDLPCYDDAIRSLEVIALGNEDVNGFLSSDDESGHNVVVYLTTDEESRNDVVVEPNRLSYEGEDGITDSHVVDPDENDNNRNNIVAAYPETNMEPARQVNDPGIIQGQHLPNSSEQGVDNDVNISNMAIQLDAQEGSTHYNNISSINAESSSSDLSLQVNLHSSVSIESLTPVEIDVHI